MSVDGCVSQETFCWFLRLQCYPGLLNVPQRPVPFCHFLNGLFCTKDFSIDSLSSSLWVWRSSLWFPPVTQHLRAGLRKRLGAGSSQTLLIRSHRQQPPVLGKESL